MKKVIYITIFIMVSIFSFLGITYSFRGVDNKSLTFELIGPSTVYIDINGEYEEYGVKVFSDNKDISHLVRIDSSNVDTYVLGEYKVKYEIEVDGNREYIYRIVKVINEEVPDIKLKGEEKVYVILNGTYYEEGYIVSDNKDKDIERKVKVVGKVNTAKVGEYKLEYIAIDSDGNVNSVSRIVVVKKPEITLADISGNKVISNLYDVTRYSNTIVKNKWNNKGLYIEGYVKDRINDYKIKLKNVDNGLEHIFKMDDDKNNYYKGNIDLSLVSNGKYELYVVYGDSEERLLNKLSGLSRLLRSKVGSRLVTIIYNDNDEVDIIVSDFKYEYDIVIDPGHGDKDIGASNGIKYEKDINLEQSMYEKCRYESMGLKVFMTRYDDSYGTMMGTEQLDHLQRRALTIGYYGTVSKITYSNHHNASVYSGDYGFEIIVPNKLNINELEVELSLYNKFSNYYGINNDRIRLYSRDYNTDIIYDKLYGSVYSYIDYYAVIRIPNELFNVKTIIFEPMFMSNPKEFSWYYMNKNWIDITEIKIKEYVEYLGYTYNKDNSMCL